MQQVRKKSGKIQTGHSSQGQPTKLSSVQGKTAIIVGGGWQERGRTSCDLSAEKKWLRFSKQFSNEEIMLQTTKFVVSF